MTDTSKRRTLKGLAAIATATTSATAFASSTGVNSHRSNTIDARNAFTDSHLTINTRVCAQTNDIEAVFTNAGNKTLSIETLTPHEITTFRGKFNVRKLTDGQPLVLAPGESVSVPVEAHDISLGYSDRANQSVSLTHALKTSASAFSTAGEPVRISVNPALPIA